MLWQHMIGRGFDSPRLHHPSLAAQLWATDGALHSTRRAATEGRRLHLASYGWQAKMYYAYIIESESREGEYYRGHSSNITKRLEEHNAGKCQHTKKFRP